MKLGIVIATYQRPDGSTPSLLKRAIDSVKNQTHQDYILIIIGDKYEDNSEFESICNGSNLKDKIVFKNLSYAKERDKYSIGSQELWCAGGVNARNCGIDFGLELGLSYMCHLDHDDYWHPQHLELINHVIENIDDVSFINTCSVYGESYLPRVDLTNQIIPWLPKPEGLIHSSVCINHKLIDLRYRDVFEASGTKSPADADLWARIHDYIKKYNLKSYLITSITCYHPTERQ
jgi:glycosyltransferase involved in cell wall biosynthesis